MFNQYSEPSTAPADRGPKGRYRDAGVHIGQMSAYFEAVQPYHVDAATSAAAIKTANKFPKEQIVEALRETNKAWMRSVLTAVPVSFEDGSLVQEAPASVTNHRAMLYEAHAAMLSEAIMHRNERDNHPASW